MPENIDHENTTSLGMVLIYMLCDQIDGKIELKRNPGTEYLITFPKNRYTNRLKDVSV